MAEGWLQRSGCLPLGIQIYEHDPTAGRVGHRGTFMNQFMSARYPRYGRADSSVCRPTLEQKYRVLELVSSYSHRWRVLDVHLPRNLLERINSDQPEDSDNVPAVKNNSGDRVQLEVIRIHQLGSPQIELRHDPFAHQPKFFSEDHAPQVLRLINVSIGDMQGIKWTNLVVLFVDTTDTEQLLTVISNAPRLESLEALRVWESYRPEKRPVPDGMAGPRTHESLRKIKLKNSLVGGLDILRRVTMPSLISLDLTLNIWERPRILQPTPRPTSGIVLWLAEFFERSQPPLSNFALEMPNVSIREILDILQTLPTSTLTNLTLERSLIAPELWTGLFDLFGRPASCTGDAVGLGAGGGQMRFPNLRELTFEHMSPEIKLSFMLWDVVADTLRDALSGPAAPFLKNLQQLTITYPTCLNDWETFHEMQAAVVKLGVLVKQDHLPLRFVATQRRE